MDRERDRDAVEEMIEEQDEKRGGGPDRARPGQHDGGSRSVDGQTPPETGRPPEKDGPQSPDPGSNPGPFAPH